MKQFFSALLLLIAVTFTVVSQNDDPEHIYTTVEQMPQFPGGDAEMMKYINKHLEYPIEAMENNIQGLVVVQFVVTRSGKVGEIKVVRGKTPCLDKEALRVVSTLPDFIPGRMNGQTVNVWYTLPISFYQHK